jgi:hypothetical protein
MVARIAGTQTEVEGAAHAFTLMQPSARVAPLVVLREVDVQRRRLDVAAVVSCTRSVRVALRVRQAGTAQPLRTVASASGSCGKNGRDLFMTLGRRLPAGAYVGRVVAASSGRETVRELRFRLG